MIIFPAIDLYESKAVRLYKGDYSAMTVYEEDVPALALRFKAAGATHMHMVDLEGARTGDTPNEALVAQVVQASGLFVQLGGGIRSFETIERYLAAGVARVILGTAAVTQAGFAAEAVSRYGEKVAVSVDVREGLVAVKGWTESTPYTCFEFCDSMRDAGVQTIICTDISKDGAMSGTNLALYGELCARYDMNIIASGGVDSLDAVRALGETGAYGAIIGKAYYTGAVDLAASVELAKTV